MEAYQERVVAEQKENDAKVAKLDAFMHSDAFDTVPAPEQHRLHRQISIMKHYSEILGERIAAWNPPA